mgnify:CR=1 FL=1
MELRQGGILQELDGVTGGRTEFGLGPSDRLEAQRGLSVEQDFLRIDIQRDVVELNAIA